MYTIYVDVNTFCGVYNKPYDVDVYTFGTVITLVSTRLMMYIIMMLTSTRLVVCTVMALMSTRLVMCSHDVDVNTFGNDVDVNTFGNDVDINTFGNDVDVNTFRDVRTELKICYCKR